MDYQKIGTFITTERKSKKLTQSKLAEKLFVSEKTVSKWENGKGIPDTIILPKLCEIFDISINELLNGERYTKEVKNQNNNLLLDMAKEIEIKNKIIWKSMWVIITISMLALFGGIMLCAFCIPEGPWQIISILSLLVVFLLPCFYALKLEISVGSYKCKHCSCEFIPNYSQTLFSMHISTTRYLKCPHCKKHSWCKKTLNK